MKPLIDWTNEKQVNIYRKGCADAKADLAPTRRCNYIYDMGYAEGSFQRRLAANKGA